MALFCMRKKHKQLKQQSYNTKDTLLQVLKSAIAAFLLPFHGLGIQMSSYKLLAASVLQDHVR